jgi:hypothetical protein
LVDLQQDVAPSRDDVKDLKDPVEEFDLFDQCIFTIGVTPYGSPYGSSGYVYGESGQERQQALAMDRRGFDRPQYDFLSLPGEEPQQIECNEDAGGRTPTSSSTRGRVGQDERFSGSWPSSKGPSRDVAV